jgi:2'-5' RNA ligase
MKKEMKRLFVALEVKQATPEGDSLSFDAFIKTIGLLFPDFKPSPSFHITLVFIGSVEQLFLERIIAALEAAVAQWKQEYPAGITPLYIKPFMALYNTALAFECENHDAINALRMSICHHLDAAGIPYDAKHPFFKPHCTLGRLKNITDTRLQDHIKNIPLQMLFSDRECALAPSSDLILYESRDGIHIPLKTFSLSS